MKTGASAPRCYIPSGVQTTTLIRQIKLIHNRAITALAIVIHMRSSIQNHHSHTKTHTQRHKVYTVNMVRGHNTIQPIEANASDGDLQLAIGCPRLTTLRHTINVPVGMNVRILSALSVVQRSAAASVRAREYNTPGQSVSPLPNRERQSRQKSGLFLSGRSSKARKEDVFSPVSYQLLWEAVVRRVVLFDDWRSDGRNVKRFR